jgi:hypothetical protein
MRRAIWIPICLVLLFVSGCIDLNQDYERECLAERRCGPSEASVCGVDGVEYECAAMAQCYGVEVDDSGQACDGQAQCEPVTCTLFCENGFATDENGCEICECEEEEPPQCEPFQCALDCFNGYKTDENGCQICECRESEGGSCGADPCISYHCGSRVPSCIKESELATMGACPSPAPGRFQEPDQQCICDPDGDFCRARDCSLEEGCPGDDGLCVTWPDSNEYGYCVEATCDDIVLRFEEIAQNYNTCSSDDDCSLYSPIYDCCGGFAVNAEGIGEMGIADAFAARTQCGRDWAETCSMVDCAEPPTNAVACVQGRCQSAR